MGISMRLCTRLASLGPRFLVPANRIQVFLEPKDFYNYLCKRISTAKSRIFLASLYMGVNEMNTHILSLIEQALHRNSSLKVDILMDSLRSTREAPSPCTASMLAALSSKFPNQVGIALYKTPKLPAILQKLIPKRVVEGAGLQHMKLYGFDNEIVLSGANLSQEYYERRQDRYIAFKDTQLCSYFYKIHRTVSNLSMALTNSSNESGFELSPPADPLNALTELDALLTENKESINEGANDDVEVYPVGQFSPLGIGNEVNAVKAMAEQAMEKDWESTFTAGYFNVYPQLGSLLARANKCTVVIASPKANGFYKSRGVSSIIPRMYALSALRFARSTDSGVSIREWQRGVVNTPTGWSYHAKGYWLEHEGKMRCTYIGSSNFTYRSYKHDLECGAVILLPETYNSEAITALANSLKNEVANIEKYTEQIGSAERILPDVTIRDRLLFKMMKKRL